MFNHVFAQQDKDDSGLIEKYEMFDFIKTILKLANNSRKSIFEVDKHGCSH